MGQRIKAVVRYDGTDFAGWQVQPETRTVQGAIEEKLALIAGGPVRICSAGRTDSGVHALAQVFHCDWPVAVPLEDLRRRLSQMLVPEIRIESIEAVAEDFHAQWHAKSKRYAYSICQGREPDPFTRRYTWRILPDVNRARVREIAQRVVGTHDFGGFCSKGVDIEDTVRTIHSVEILEGPVVGPRDARDHWRIEFEGDGFLYKMVRNLVGTFVEIAREKIPDSTIEEILRTPKYYTGFTAPACGLFLVDVSYSCDAASPGDE